MENKIQINFKEIIVTDLTGEIVKIPELHELIANRIFRTSPTIPTAEAAKLLYYGESVSITAGQIMEILAVIENYFLAIVQIAITDYLNEKLNIIKQQQDENEQENSN